MFEHRDVRTITDKNGRLVSLANAFPGNKNAKPDFSKADPLFAEAFKIYQTGYLANEFTGLPVAEDLMREMTIEVQNMFDGHETAQQVAANTQKQWLVEFAK